MMPILVTGGALGLGRAICEKLASDKHDVVIHYRKSEEEATNLVEFCKKKGVSSQKIQGDFSSPELTRQFLENYLSRFGKTKGIVNNVGNFLKSSLMQTKEEDWQAMIQTNLLAPIAITQKLCPQIIEQKGTILNIGTIGLQPIRAKTSSTAYVVSKQGLWSYTLCLAKELASKSVNVNMLSPGFMENSVDLPLRKNLPMQRLATLEEAADLAAFFFRPESAYITGQNVEISGGYGL